MMRYGAGFADFLAGVEALSHIGYLADVARLEQAVRSAYHAADADPVATDALQSVDPEKLGDVRFDLAPALRLVRSPWPIHQIWAYNLEDGAPKPAGGAQNVLILRPEFDPELTPITDGCAQFVTALLDNDTLSDANDAALAADEGFDLSQALGLLLSGQAITRIITGEDP